jgi:hypothetical protein
MLCSVAELGAKKQFFVIEKIFSLLRLLLPLADIELLYAAGAPAASGGSGLMLSEEEHLSPFHRAIDRKNWDSLAVLATRLDPTRFLLPIMECGPHWDKCLTYKISEHGEEDDSSDSSGASAARYLDRAGTNRSSKNTAIPVGYRH